MSVRSKAQRILTVALALVFLAFSVVGLSISVGASSVLYSYNGVQLPSLLEWDVAKYPYARIYYSSTLDAYCLNVCSVPLVAVESELYYLPVEVYPTYSHIVYYVSDGEWTRMRYGDDRENSGLDGSAIADLATLCWANYDILNYADGTVVFAATEPVLVGSSAVTSVDLSRNITEMQKGLDYSILIDVTGTGDFDPSCTCVVSGNTSADTYVYLDDTEEYDTPNLYHLVIGEDETADTLTITATSVQNPSISATHTVTLTDPVIPGITGIDLSRTETRGSPGGYVQILIDTEGVGTYNDECTCVVSGGTSADTVVHDVGGDSYENRYVLLIGADETSALLHVTATSVAKPEITATISIELDAPGVSSTEPDATSPADDPTTPDVTTPPADEPDKDDFIGEGESILDDLDDVIPDYTDEFSVVIKEFADSMSYEGTDCKFMFPAIIFPAIPGLINEFQFNEEKEVDFAVFFELFPDPILTLVQLLLTAALIVYCVKELYDMVQYVLTMNGGGS